MLNYLPATSVLYGKSLYKCSICNHVSDNSNYCPNCFSSVGLSEKELQYIVSVCSSVLTAALVYSFICSYHKHDNN